MLWEVVETIGISLCSKESYYGVFIDLSKAFDTLSQEILLQNCFAYGLRGKIYDTLNSSLTNRQQCVSFSKRRSYFKSIFLRCTAGFCFRATSALDLCKRCLIFVQTVM